MPSSVKKQILKITNRKYGLNIQSDALDYLDELLSSIDNQDILKTIDRIAQAYLQQQGSVIIDLEKIQSVIDAIQKSASLSKNNAELSTYFQVWDAFSLDSIAYNVDKKSFYKKRAETSLWATADRKTALLKERFDIILQRVQRTDLIKKSQILITPIKNLIGQRGAFRLFGMLTQMTEGKLHLEDTDGFIELCIDDSVVQVSVGFFCWNSFVLVEGNYTDEKKFFVTKIDSPSGEERKDTYLAHGDRVDVFSDHRPPVELSLLLKVEKREDPCFIFISEVWLNDEKVIHKLKKLFEGYEQDPPFCFVLMGNFSSHQGGHRGEYRKQYIECFDNLAELIIEFPKIHKMSQFVMIPGVHDGAATNILPYQKIPEHYHRRFKNKIPNSYFSSNPSKITYCTQEFIVFRSDAINKMRKSNVIPLNKSEADIREHVQLFKYIIYAKFVKTIVDQSHLAPLPLSKNPVFWNYDHALRLYPLPDLIVVADSYDTYSILYMGTQIINPGAFSINENFIVYYPSTRQCQESQVKFQIIAETMIRKGQASGSFPFNLIDKFY